MYIKTPKRYRGTQRRNVFSCGRLFVILLLMSLIALGIGIYQMQDMLRPYLEVAMATAAVDAENWRATQFAPTALPTVDPSRSLIDADNNWQAGRVSMALDNYRNVLSVVPNDVEVYSRVTLAYLTRGDLDAALRYAENTVTADPFNADAWATRSLVYAWEDDPAQAIASAQQALALQPEHPAATAFLGYAYYESDLYDRASSTADDAVEINPNGWEGYWVRGIIRENYELDLAGALGDYQVGYQYAVEQNPAMAGVLATGWARVLLNPDYNRGDEAIEVLNNALTLDPDNVEVLFAIGNYYYAIVGDYSQAQDPLTDCTTIAPQHHRCWFLLGRSLYNQNQVEAALAAFEEAINQGTPYARHYWWAANVKISNGDCPGATSYLETGYDMVIEGGLPAVEEGNSQLISEFEYNMGLCRVPINGVVPTEATAEVTEEAE